MSETTCNPALCRLPPSRDDKGRMKATLRQRLVGFLFSLVLAQLFISVLSVVDVIIETDVSWRHWLAPLVHLALAFFVVTTSWFGWAMSCENEWVYTRRSMFQRTYVLAVIDCLLVGIYFALVRGAEVVSASPLHDATKSPSLRESDSIWETRVLAVVFLLYLVWDVVSLGDPDRKKKGNVIPWPSLLSIALAVWLCIVANRSQALYDVVAIDLGLVALVLFFRAAKWFQRPDSAHPNQRVTAAAIGSISLMVIIAVSMYV